MAKNTEPIKVTADEPGRYLQVLGAGVGEVLRDNVGDTITPLDFERIKVPAGGGTHWRISTLEGEKEEKTINGVIVQWRPPRAMWRESFDQSGGGTPPDCSSQDGVYGVGDPGGECARCPFNVFGTADNGNARGKACKEMRALFVMTENSVLPYLFLMPPTSIPPIKKYMLQLTAARKGYWEVETGFSLERTKNKGGIEFSRLVPMYKRTLSEDEARAAAYYRSQLTPMLEHAPIDIDSSDISADGAPFD